MIQRPRSVATGLLVLLGLALGGLLTVPTARAQEEAAPPSGQAELETLAESFFEAFAEKDLERIETMFAEGALVQRARLQPTGAPELDQFDATAWLEESGEAIAGIDAFQVETLSMSVLEFDDGASVLVRFRATGNVGGGHFVNNGVDTLSFVRLGGAWRIVLYQSMEELVFHPGTQKDGP